jgi:monoterpene epsilon-lactone hydrolase
MSLEERDAIAAMLLARRGPPPADPTERRAGFARFAAGLWPDAPPAPKPFDLAPGLPARLFPASSGRADRLLVWLHGGAFAVGSSATHAPMLAMLAGLADCPVLAPDYRLVPEAPFPAAWEDAQSALAWALDRHPPERVAVGGDSSGGNLAVAAVQARLAHGLAPPAAVVLHSPYLDLTDSGESMVSRAPSDPFVNPAMRAGEAYRGAAPADDPRVSPLFGPVKGLPPTLVQVGSDEALYDDARRFTVRLWETGATCVFQEWAGMVHCWPLAAGRLEEGRWALAQTAAFLGRALG